MNFTEDQILELKSITPDLSMAQDGGYTYIRIDNLQLPDHCNPNVVNALLCPAQKDGYESSLFYSAQITGCPSRNWNRVNVRILEENWFAISWRVNPGLRLSEMLLIHLSALR
ncbi:hypothetical protein EV143_101180 [Flavobacterium chryseum]|uniref:hypothetical protein n=1 Tax=Flavobacterium sp. P3160 TaxID=2512113 RepID=UPI00106141F2|nr:hypothetical protein [Flavobacterium sp. P3160]TDO83740.1 hypothetical protein EV143_101180 [Flavobacterium sp. P3160]